MSPYLVTATEVVTTFATTDQRKNILHGWLRHRAQLRAIGFNRGFQWLDGSFVENKDPHDLDIVTFLYRPLGARDSTSLMNLMTANIGLFDRTMVKNNFRLDFFPVDLDGSPESLVNVSRYLLGLFSHRRGDDLWKGMLQVRLEDGIDDAVSLTALGPDPLMSGTAGGMAP